MILLSFPRYSPPAATDTTLIINVVQVALSLSLFAFVGISALDRIQHATNADRKICQQMAGRRGVVEPADVLAPCRLRPDRLGEFGRRRGDPRCRWSIDGEFVVVEEDPWRTAPEKCEMAAR